MSTTPFTNNQVASSIGDIFYGRIDLTGDNAECKSTSQLTDNSNKNMVWIRRKVAALTIVTRNLQSELNTTDEDFSYVVRQTYGTLDFGGTLKGDKVAYHPASHINSVNKDLVAPMFYTYASQDDDGFCIDIYKGAELVGTYCTDKDEQQMLLKEAKYTVVLIDFKNKDSGGYLESV